MVDAAALLAAALHACRCDMRYISAKELVAIYDATGRSHQQEMPTTRTRPSTGLEAAAQFP